MNGIGGTLAAYPQEAMAKSAYQPSTRERLKQSLESAEHALADIKRAVEILDNNPELEELLNILARNVY